MTAALTAALLASAGMVAGALPAAAESSGMTVDAGFGAPFQVWDVTDGPDGWLAVGTNGGLMALTQDGSPNTTFNDGLGTGAVGSTINAVVASGDGWLIGGQVFSIDGVAVNNLVRLDADGSVDSAFASNIGGTFGAYVNAVAADGDGWMVGGQFAANGAIPRHLVRLHADGTPDTAFNANIPHGQHVMAVASDGEQWLLGTFLQGSSGAPLIMLNADGTIDPFFTGRANSGAGFDSWVRSVAWDGDGWLVGGYFTSRDGEPAVGLIRLDEQGNRDTAFDASFGGFSEGRVYDIEQDGDGWLVAGYGLAQDGVSLGSLVRLTSDGSLDEDFLAARVTGTVNAVRADGTGRLVLGGAVSLPGVTTRGLLSLAPATLGSAAIADQTSTVGTSAALDASASVTSSVLTELPAISYAATGLPAGLSINASTGQITGTPTTPGTSTVTVTSSVPLLTDSVTFTWLVNQAPSLSGTPTTGTAGVPYSYSFAVGGSPAATVSLDDGPLPAGLTLAADGTLSGTPTQAGLFAFTVRASNGVGSDAVLTTFISVAPGAVDLSASTIVAAPTTVVADGVDASLVTVRVEDAYGNLVPGTSLTIESTVGTVGTVTGGGGTHVALVSSSVTGTATISFTVDGQAGAGTATVDFVHGEVSLTDSEISASAATVVADGTDSATVTVLVTDANGHGIAGLDVALTGLGAGAGELAGPVVDLGDGRYQADVVSTTTGPTLIGYTVDGEVGAGQAAIQFVPGAADLVASTILALPASVVADGVSSSTVRIDLVDVSGHAVPGRLVETSSTLGDLSAVVDNGDGSYVATLTAPVRAGTGTVLFTVDGEQGEQVAEVTFTAVAVDVSLGHAERTGGQEQTVTGTGFLPGESVVVTMASVPVTVGEVVADGSGTAVLAFEVPMDAEGGHTVTMAGQDSRRNGQASFAVVVGGSGTDGGDNGAGGGSLTTPEEPAPGVS